MPRWRTCAERGCDRVIPFNHERCPACREPDDPLIVPDGGERDERPPATVWPYRRGSLGAGRSERGTLLSKGLAWLGLVTVVSLMLTVVGLAALGALLLISRGGPL